MKNRDLKACPMKYMTSLGFYLFLSFYMGMWLSTFLVKLMAMATSIRDVTTLMNFLHLICCWIMCWVLWLSDKIFVWKLGMEEVWLKMEIRSANGGFKQKSSRMDFNEAKCIYLGFCVCVFWFGCIERHYIQKKYSSTM